MKSLFVMLILIGYLSACGITGKPIPQDHFYRLPQANIDAAKSSSLESLQLVAVTADGLYNERNLLYVDASRPLEISRYHYHYWLESPLTLIAKFMSEALQSSRVAAQFSGPGDKPGAQARMLIQIVHFERIIEANSISVKVSLKVSVDNQGNKSDSWQKLYNHDQVVASNDMHDTARAFGEALNTIAQMLINDLSGK